MDVGVVGLGQIGSGLVRGLVGGGHSVFVHDVRPEAAEQFGETVTWRATLAELGAGVEVLLVAVVNDQQVTDVLTEALPAMRAGTNVAVVSTISIPTLERVTELASERGVGVVDCGVTGGPAAAAQSQLVSMVGGADECFEAVKPALEAFSSVVLRMGDLGSGMRAKLARQVVQFGSWLACFEAQRIAEAAGVDLQRLAQAIKAGDATTGGAAALMFRRTTAPWSDADDAGLVGAMRTAAGLARKDVVAAGDLAGELGLHSDFLDLLGRDLDSVFGFAL